ncbi:MAG: alpha/beta hydrolase fold domain-containing protein [Chthoniobacterales bacterium]
MRIATLLLAASLALSTEAPAATAKPRENLLLKAVRDTLGIDAMRREFIYAKIPGEDLQLDIYYPRAAPPPGGYPLIIWIHGGGWILGSKRQDVFVRHFPRYGYAVASLEYRLAEGAPFPAQIRDVRVATDWLLKNAHQLELDASQFVVAGQSAGGHLALLLAFTQGEPHPGWGPAPPRGSLKAVCAMYPPTDLLRLVPPSARDNPIHPVAILLGGRVAQHMPLAWEASPDRYVSKGDPPTLLFHGSEDPIVPIAQSYLMDARLKASGVPVRMLVTEKGHAFTLYPDRVPDVLEFLNAVPGLPQTAVPPRR